MSHAARRGRPSSARSMRRLETSGSRHDGGGATDGSRSSMRFVRFPLHQRLRNDQVHFPGLAAVSRERLIETARIRSDVRDAQSNQNGSAVELFLIVELGASALELADRRWAQGTRRTAGNIDAPLMGLAVVETQGQELEVTCRALDLDFAQVGASVPDAANDVGTVVVDPGGRACQRM